VTHSAAGVRGRAAFRCWVGPGASPPAAAATQLQSLTLTHDTHSSASSCRRVVVRRALVEGGGDGQGELTPAATTLGAVATEAAQSTCSLWQGEEEEEEYAEAEPSGSSLGMLRDIMVVGIPEMLR
jgi:hypothetical protein